MPDFDVFLCHNSADKPAVEEIARKLKARGIEPWLDKWGLRPGFRWIPEIEKQVREIDAAAVFVGTSGIGPWQDEEVDTFLRQFHKRKCPVIPVLLPGCSPDPELPPFLDGRTRVDFRGDADEAFELLVWGITDDPPAYTDDETRELSERLEALYEQRADLEAEGGDLTATQAEILDLRRRLRDRQYKAGELLGDGRYKLKKSLGHGGFAEVWRAFDRTSRKIVALKALHSQYCKDGGKRARFLRGARKMAELDHPGIVRVLGEPWNADEDCFFVMEYLPGGDLRAAARDGRLGRAAGLAAVLEIGDALAHAHARGLVHRDVKPANILLTGDGRAKLTDFDLVRAADTTGGTRTQAMGSFVYAAPEVMRDAAKADARADVFGLAMTAVFVLHGADLPVDALFDTAEFLEDEVETPDAMREVLLRGLARKPKRRTATVEAFCEELRRVLEEPVDEAAQLACLPPDLSEISEPSALTPQRYRAPTKREKDERIFTEIETPLDGVVPLWREIPAGEFVMGSDYSAEKPRHRVEITSPFRLAAVPVTNAQFQAFRPDFKPHAWDGISAEELRDHPAINVDWDDAREFCEWLAERYDWAKGARLPTETEWEHACRAGTTTEYWSGDKTKDLDRVGWFAGNENERTHRVGEKLANPFGLYDVHGNVWEWTLTHWDGSSDYSEFADGRTIDPSASPADLAGPPRDGRVVRGGGYWNTAEYARSAFRNRGQPSDRYQYVGFRVLLPGVVSPS